MNYIIPCGILVFVIVILSKLSTFMKILLIFGVGMIIPWINIICTKIAGYNPGKMNVSQNIKNAIWFDVMMLIIVGCLLLLKIASSWI